MERGIAYIIMTEHYDPDNYVFHTYNRAVFLDEESAIEFLGIHSPSEYEGCDDEFVEFTVDVLAIVNDVENILEPSDKLNAALDAANK